MASIKILIFCTISKLCRKIEVGCFCVLSIQTYADWKKLDYLTYAKSLNRENKLKVEILHNLKEFWK